MEIALSPLKEPLLSALLSLRRRRKLDFSSQALELSAAKVSFGAILDVKVAEPSFLGKLLGWNTIEISFTAKNRRSGVSICLTADETLVARSNIKASVSSFFSTKITQLKSQLLIVENRHSTVYDEKTFVRKSLAIRFTTDYFDVINDGIQSLSAISTHAVLGQALKKEANGDLARYHALSPYVFDTYETHRRLHNEKYQKYWMATEAEYFRNVESDELSAEQIAASLSFEDATLTVAAAGSGKSSCIVGKIGFALKTGLFNDDQILALAYNKKAAKSLKNRLEKKLSVALKRDISVASKTFHGFGLSTLIKHYGSDYEPRVLKEDEGEEGRFIKSVIQELLESNTNFQSALSLWFATYPYESPEPVGVSGNLDECAKRYEECCRDRLRIRSDNSKKPWDPSIPTFDGDIYVRSLEERSIANWLTLHGVKFKYELPDWKGAVRLGLGTYASGKQKPYSPDFTYEFTEELANGDRRQVRVVHEHFALNAAGQAPEWMGGQKYEEHARQKRAMYSAWVKEKSISERLVFFETTSAQMRDGTLWDFLKKQLVLAGINIAGPDENIRRKALSEFRNSANLEQLIIDWVLRFKESGLSESDVRAVAASSFHPHRSHLFINVAIAVFNGYQSELKNSGKIDYADMLRDAHKLISNGTVKIPYQFLLVDEFQDISRLRAQLVKSVLDLDKDNSLLFCVGDDWQTINRFSGSDVAIFREAGEYFHRYAESVLLSKTFRSSQGIADVARSLVMQNSIQIDKPISAPPSKIHNCIRVVLHDDVSNARQEALEAELHRFVSLAIELEIAEPTVQILRRTQTDSTSPEGLQESFLKTLVKKFSGKLSIDLLSFHGAKGLEADFVALVGLDSGYRGFPDERPSEPLLDLVLPKLASAVEEDRRLMYVGLTRARHAVTLLGANSRPSEFILDLEKRREKFPFIEWSTVDNIRIPCPRCGVGSLISRTGSTSPKYCSRTSACGFRPSKML